MTVATTPEKAQKKKEKRARRVNGVLASVGARRPRPAHAVGKKEEKREMRSAPPRPPARSGLVCEVHEPMPLVSAT